ncbi:MAG: sigma-70 family RNA polymerase sigma factor [Bryobacterales bacterium]|nr:sigma-70 family RNA polymerase sigma factor [Bryobacterales bacterium]
MKLDGAAFQLLLGTLSDDPGEAGALYESLRQRLLRYFGWERSLHPEELADDVLDRIARKLQDGETIRDLPSYAIGVARLVASEERTRNARRNVLLAEAARTHPSRDLAHPANSGEEPDPCFARCLGELPPESRHLLERYYSGDGNLRIRNRKKLAETLGLELNALRNRALRLRERLEQCIDRCRKREKLSRMMDRQGGGSKDREQGSAATNPGPRSEDRHRMISFLLDQLPEPEREPVRARLAADPEYFDAMQELEYDLCDSYVRGTLDAAPAAALAELERISPYWQQRLQVARQLHNRRPLRSPSRASDLRLWALAAVASFALLLAGYQSWRQTAPPPSQPLASITAALVPGTLRGAADRQQIQVPAGTELVRLELEADGLAAGPPAVRATLESDSGQQLLFVRAVEVTRPNRVQLRMPAALLAPGSYMLRVQRGEDAPYEYRFTVTVRP